MKALIIAICLSGCSATVPQCLTEAPATSTGVESNLEVLNKQQVCYLEYKQRPRCPMTWSNQSWRECRFLKK